METGLSNKLHKRIQRLEIAVVMLSVLFVILIITTFYVSAQVKAVSDKIPSYNEIKEDIKTLNKIYKVSEVEVPKAYNYTKGKTLELFEYIKTSADSLLVKK